MNENNSLPPIVKYLLIPFMFVMFIVTFLVPSLSTATNTYDITNLNKILSYLNAYGYTAIASPSGDLTVPGTVISRIGRTKHVTIAASDSPQIDKDNNKQDI